MRQTLIAPPPESHPPREPATCARKRLMDLAGAGLLLVLTSPVFLAAPLLIRLESRGPALFRQVRIGCDGTPFVMYKFRSMCHDAETRLSELAGHNELDGPVFKMRNDPRITRVGRVLRRFSLDELPQLVNVLKGEMSLVGPRPALPQEVARYTERDRRRLRVKPGLTGTWQVSGRSALPYRRWIELDLAYITNWSLRNDLRICLQTVKAVIKGTGAY